LKTLSDTTQYTECVVSGSRLLECLLYSLEVRVRVKRCVNGLAIDDLGCFVGWQKNSVRWIIYADPEAFRISRAAAASFLLPATM
jgi:hypothetical protein